MGQCVGKPSKRVKSKEKGLLIPPDSPLAEMLGKWNKIEECKDLERLRMIYYCMEVWPANKIIEAPVYWPKYGTKEKWLCEALVVMAEAKTGTEDIERRYARCWKGCWEEAGVYKVTAKRDIREDNT